VRATATEHLRREHEEIRALLDRLEGALAPLNLAEVRHVCGCLEILLARHQRKEREVFFPALARKADGRHPELGAVAHEHARQETYAEMIRAFLGILGEYGGSVRPLVEACRSLITFYRDHLQHEEAVLFPRADEELSTREQEDLALQMMHLEAAA
jgi:iron-sulfur cluster repair protein YtfE (RIC family)